MNLDIKYRYKDFDKFIGNEQIVKDVKGFLKTGDPPHFIFIGPPGVGKNTLYWMFASKFLGREITYYTEDGDKEYLEINAGKDTGIDTVRDVIGDFASFVVRNHRKCCLIDEFDSATVPMQMALKHVTERNEDKCHFCFIVNDDSRIIDALRSRCCTFRFKKPNISKVCSWFLDVAIQENVIFENESLIEDIAEFYERDFRKMLVDCLEALRGRTIEGGKITKDDLWKIYEGDTKSIAKKVYESDDKINLWTKYWKDENFDNRRFIEDLSKLYNGKYAHIFAKIDARLRKGCNPMLQMNSLFAILDGK
jgi:replication factor C small subunit